MSKLLARCALFSFVLMSAAAAAEPVKLKLAFPSSDRSTSYLAAVKPFVDAVNAEARGLVEIETYFSGALGKDPAEQPQLVLDGTADIAYVVTGLTRNRFAENAIIEMPGLFASMRESVAVFTRLVAANALQGYDDYTVIGAFVTEPETIHSKTPITSLADLKGKRIRVNNPGEAAALPGRDRGGGRVQRRHPGALPRQQPGGADERMACERQLDGRREDPELSVRGLIHEHGLAEAELRRDRLTARRSHLAAV